MTPAPAREAEIAAEYALGTPIDLEACRTEAIHLLGTVQSYGVLLAMDEPGTTIVTVSDNAAAVLGRDPASLLGRSVDEVLGVPAAEQLRRSVAPLGGSESALVTAQVPGTGPFDVSLHRSDGLVVAEFEPARREEAFDFAAFSPVIRDALRSLNGAATVTDLADRAVREVRRITGYDRVVVYRFDGDGPGHVIAEALAEGWESWLGLWFPAIDVPPQARRLYLRNWIRSIADVDTVPAALVPALLPGRDQPLDMSGAVLRSLSPYHVEYLRNIGVTASMSISLIKDGSLWGLVACHSGQPLRLSPEARAACEFLGAALSIQLVAIERVEETAARADANARLTRAMVALPGGFPGSLLSGDPSLFDLIPSQGAHLRLGELTGSRGTVPDGGTISEILRHVPPGPPGTVWSTDSLSSVDPALADLADVAAGVLVLRLSRDGDALVWFRPELVRTVRWAADPARPAVLGTAGQRLTPRGSHTVWRETVRGRAPVWLASELELATSIGRAVYELILHRHAELAELNADLRRSNQELDSFAYVTAHDLKEPLRGIAMSAEFALEDDPDLDPGTAQRITTIRTLAVRMDELLNSLLQFAQVGRADRATEQVDLNGLADEVLDLVAPRAQSAMVTVRRVADLPVVRGNRSLLREVLTNLVVNAIKYAGPAEPRWVQIDTVTVPAPWAPRQLVSAVVVRDNGIGIPPEMHEEVFRMFRRLDPSRADGLGAGLTIARKIVERHGGRLWVESGDGPGARFHLALPPDTEH